MEEINDNEVNIIDQEINTSDLNVEPEIKKEKTDRIKYYKEYRIKNKENIHKPEFCNLCQKMVKHSNLARHSKTKTHIKNLGDSNKTKELPKTEETNMIKTGPGIIIYLYDCF